MTFDRPLLLFALALAPLAYLAGRLRARRITVVVGSLLIFERAVARLGVPEGRERRRAVDARLLAELLALALLALAAAGPRISALGPPRRVAVALDDGASMRAKGRPEGVEAALAAVRSQLGPEGTLVLVRASEAPRDARDPVLWAALAARAQGAGRPIAITDHALPEDAAESVLVGGENRRNRGIVAAGLLEGGELLVRTDADDAEVAVTDAAGKVLLRGRGREVRGWLPAEALGKREPFTVRLEGEDALAEDDVVRLVPPGAPPPVRVLGPPSEAFVRALRAAGVEEVAREGGQAAVTFEIAPAPGPGPAPVFLVAHETERFRYADLSDQDVHVAPAAAPVGLAPLLTDDRGRLLVGHREGASGELFWIGIPMSLGEAATDWPKRRSFPLFVAEAIASRAPLGEGPDEWGARGLLSAELSSRAGPISPPPPEPALAARSALRAVASEDPERRGAPVERPALAAAAGFVALSWILARERSSGRPADGEARARSGSGGRPCAAC